MTYRTIDHQLVYKNYGDGYKFHLKEPKTDAGVRTIPMTSTVKKAFLKQREYQMMPGCPKNRIESMLPRNEQKSEKN